MSSLFPDIRELEILKDQSLELPTINAGFCIPRLADKPQDPIMDTLKRSASSATYIEFKFDQLPPEIELITQDHDEFATSVPLSKRLGDSIWLDAVRKDVSGRSFILSWDALRTSTPAYSSPSGFLSEQDSVMFAAARHYVQPKIIDANTVVQYISIDNLLRNMKLTALGISSSLHIWDPASECFVDTGVENGMRKVLLVDGKDEIISTSIMSRFLKIGTSLRRLEKLVADLRSRTSSSNPTTHAFAHALSTILVFLRQSLAAGPPSEDQLSATRYSLSTILFHYEPVEGTLEALCRLCNRDESSTSNTYTPLPASPQTLLSRIYEGLESHIEHQSSHLVISIFAFILTNTSRDYFEKLSFGVGFGGSRLHPLTIQHHQRLVEDGDERSRVDDFKLFDEKFPVFCPSELASALPIARKSLILLRAAQPDHPLLHIHDHSPPVRWFWTVAEILAAVRVDHEVVYAPGVNSSVDELVSSPSTAIPNYQHELQQQFKIFDLEPGSLGRSYFDSLYTAAPQAALQNFIQDFPKNLPSITPTLAHLTSLVFQPLLSHASTLSSTLLSLFLSLPAPLDVHSHLKLLQSHMLLMSPAFKARLSTALFSDSDDFDTDIQSQGKITLGSLRRKTQKIDLKSKTWAVGLAPALLDRAAWPPMDSDLSFFLRTVIMDSFEAVAEEEARRKIVEEVESRLGFAVRDLPVGPGQSEWMTPFNIEAFDFLYMDYKPPHPLEVIITPEILSKYQRMFTLLLRILRVQHAINAVFRMTRSATTPIFPTLFSAHKLFMHFRFVAQSFVTNLSTYVYDTAIGGNFDPFLASLRTITASKDRSLQFADSVFSLAEAHSKLLDDILTACLMRTAQRVAGGLLRDALELVLDLAVLTGDLYRGRMEEYQAASLLENLYRQFRKKMTALVKALRGTEDQDVSLRTLLDIPQSLMGQNSCNPIGGIEALPHLLIRLDLCDWWSEPDRAGQRLL